MLNSLNSKDIQRAKKAVWVLNKHIQSSEKTMSPETIEILKEIVRNACAKSLFFFAKYVLNFSLLTEQTHKRWCEKLQEDFQVFDYFMRLKPRKTYKTTIYGEAFILWIWAIYSAEIQFFYVSANSTLIEEVSAHMDYFLKSGGVSLYSFVFGIFRDDRLRPNTTMTYNIIGKNEAKKGSSLTFRTSGGSVNGIHPNIIIIDDPMDKNDRESEMVRRKKVRWYESLFPLLSPFKLNDIIIQKLMFITTRWHMDDLANHVILQNEDSPEDEKFDIEIESIYTDTGAPSYPDFFPDNEIKKIQSKISDVFFACQYLNNPLPDGLSVFNRELLHFYDTSIFSHTDGYNICFLDPSQGKKESDFPAVVWANYSNGVIRFFDAIDVIAPLDEMLSRIADKNINMYGIREMWFEDNGTMLLDKNIERAHKNIDSNYKINIYSQHETRNKHERIMGIQPNLYSGAVQFRDDYERSYPEMMNQIFYYPVWSKVDYPDVIEKVVTYFEKKMINIPIPRRTQARESFKSKVKNLPT